MVLLTLAPCIGANSAIFSVINAVLLRPLPFPEPDRLVTINNSYPKAGLSRAGVSIPDYLDRIARAPSLNLLRSSRGRASISVEAINPPGWALKATPSPFPMLGVTPALGRVFADSEAQPGQDRVVVLGHALWKDHFGGRSNLIGNPSGSTACRTRSSASCPLDSNSPTGGEIVGAVRLYSGTAFQPGTGREFSDMYARLKPGATPQQLEQECATLIRQNVDAFPEAKSWVEKLWLHGGRGPGAGGHGGRCSPDAVAGPGRRGGGVAHRMRQRRKPAADPGPVPTEGTRHPVRAGRGTRAAGPADRIRKPAALRRGRPARMGRGAVGIVGGGDLRPDRTSRAGSVTLDGRVLWFTVATAGLTALSFGLLPAWQGARADAAEALRDGGGRTSTGSSQLRLRQALVVVEVALAVALLATAGCCDEALTDCSGNARVSTRSRS